MVILLGWLSHKSREPSLPFYLIHSLVENGLVRAFLMEIGTKMNGIDEAEIETQPTYSESTSKIATQSW